MRGKKGKKREKKEKKKETKEASGLKSHRISAYRFLPIGEGWTVVRSRRTGKKRAKAISNGPSGGKRSRANSDLEKLKL